MRNFWQRFQASLTPGVRILLFLSAAAYLAAVAGRLVGAVDLNGCLALSGPKFWSGQIWRIVTYALLPAGILDFIFNGIALVVLGGFLERHWSRGELWLYWLVTVTGAGVAKVVLQFSNPLPLTGAAPMMVGLLAAWAFLCGRERIPLVPFGEITVWKLVLFAGTLIVFVMYLTAGLVAATIMIAGGLTGLIFLRLRHKWMMNRAGSIAHSERITRLEL
jgi:membrane associated rhomboid family serine protease